ncbi:MAG: deoxyribonuclease IV [Bryobacterales bacterium]
MPKLRIGAHTSTAGSLANAAREALELGCNCFQIFTRSPRTWAAPDLKLEQVAELKELRAKNDLTPLVVHGSYLLNLASGIAENRANSIAGFRDEVQRSLAIGADYLVFHPGSAKDHDSAEAAIASLADAFAEATKGLRWNGLEVLLENTAGGGATLGRDLGELAEIRAAILRKKRNAPIGYCLDTAHLYVSGYDIATEDGLEDVLHEIGDKLGLDRAKVLHTNDSKTKFASRVDRHEHIGEGTIGAAAFRRILHHPKLRNKVFILETPHGRDGTHRKNVEALKKLARG